MSASEQRGTKRLKYDGGYTNGESSSSPPYIITNQNSQAAAIAIPEAVSEVPKKILRGKRELSCAECRRLKLKCDRVFPCHSCCKRGCQEICPEGSLTSGRGSRFILANTEQLHEKIAQLNERIRQLEDALESLQASCTTAPHPLLSEELRQLKTYIEVHPPADTDPPKHREAPASQPYPPPPRQALQTYAAIQPRQALPPPQSHNPLQQPAQNQVSCCTPTKDTTANQRQDSAEISSSEERALPKSILALSAAFPVPWRLDSSTRNLIRSLLPSQEEAQHLCEQARQNALWQFDVGTYIPVLVRHVYTALEQDLSSRKMSLLLILMAIGTAVDLGRPMDVVTMERYFTLSRACICDISILDEPNFDSLRAMFYMTWYFLMFDNDNRAVASAFMLLGVLTKQAQSIGMHRDSHRIKAIHEDVESKRAFLWELANLDARLSLAVNRPPSLCPAYVDCRQPIYDSSGIYDSREEAMYHEWKHTFFSVCLNPILLLTIPTRYCAYENVLELDGTVRDFVTPPLLDLRETHGPRYLVMQRALVSTGRETSLLHLHRRHCTQALSGSDQFTLEHNFAPSVVATYCTATALITTTETIYIREPQLSLRFLGLWFNAFSAGITLSMLVARAPATPIAVHALNALVLVIRLFENVRGEMQFCAQTLPTLLKSAARSREIYLKHRHPPYHDGISYYETTIPESFRCTHPALQTAVSILMETQHPPEHQIPLFHTSDADAVCPVWSDNPPLQEVFKFNSFGFGKNLDGVKRQDVIEPRFSAESYHFDCGELTTDHSYMAWF